MGFVIRKDKETCICVADVCRSWRWRTPSKTADVKHENRSVMIFWSNFWDWMAYFSYVHNVRRATKERRMRKNRRCPAICLLFSKNPFCHAHHAWLKSPQKMSKIFERELQQSRCWICFSQNSQTNRFWLASWALDRNLSFEGCVGIFWEKRVPLTIFQKNEN